MKIKFAVLVVTMVCAVPMFAQTNDLTVWLTSQINDEGGQFSEDDSEEVRFDSGSGFGISASHYWEQHHVSAEVGLWRTASGASLREAGVTIADLGDVDLTPITAMVRLEHRARVVNLYAGVGLAYVLVDDLDSEDLDLAGVGPVSLDSKTTYVLGAGAGFTLTPRFGLVVDARFMPLELEGRLPTGQSLSANLDPILLSAGLRFRF